MKTIFNENTNYKFEGVVKDGRKKVASFKCCYVDENKYNDERAKQETFGYYKVTMKNRMFNIEGTLNEVLKEIENYK